MILKLIKNSIKSSARKIASNSNYKLFFILLICLALVLLAAGEFALLATAFSLLRQKLPQLRIVYFFSLIYLVCLIILPYLSIDKSFNNLFVFYDLPLLTSSPLKPRSIFLAKYFLIYLQSSWLITLIMIVFGFSYGFLLNNWFFFDLFFLISYFIFSFMSILIGSFIATSLVKLLSVPRFKEFLAASKMIPIMIFLIISPLGSTNNASRTAASLGEIAQTINTSLTYIRFSFLPSTWLGNSLQFAEKGYWQQATFWFIPILLLAMVLLFINLWLYNQIFEISTSDQASLKIPKKSFLKLKWLNYFIRKDFAIWARSSIVKVQMLMASFGMLILVYKFTKVSQLLLGMEKASLALMLGIITSLTFTSRLFLACISIESKAFWVIAVSPLEKKSFIKNKFLVGFLPTIAISMLISLISAVFLGVSLNGTLWLLAILPTFCLVISAIGIFAGALFPKMTWPDLSQASTGLSSLVFFQQVLATLFFST